MTISKKTIIDSEHSQIYDNDNPFALRLGKTLSWRNVSMSVPSKKVSKGNEKNEFEHILKNVWGQVPKHAITAVMGPSGSGKTTLMNILSGRAQTKGKITVNSEVLLDNNIVDPTNLDVRQQIAFVAQDDSLLPTATPRECIKFSARLRLPRDTTEQELDSLTTNMLLELGLTHCADTCVGGGLIKGISGGERKRTSVGVELVTKPALVFLDEPTSGLDSFSAIQVVDVLKKVANAGSSVMFTIHQPASEVFSKFDHLIFLNKGLIMYQGFANQLPKYLENHSKPLPTNHNPSDWVMSLAQTISLEELKSNGFFMENSHIIPDSLSEASSHEFMTQCKNESKSLKKVSIIIQIRMLFHREYTNMTRDTNSLIARLGITTFLSLLFGIIFLDVASKGDLNMTLTQSHFGAGIMILTSTMFGSAQPTLFAIADQCPAFLREYSTNHYGILAYILSRLTMEALLSFLQILLQQIIVYFMIGFQANFFHLLAITYALSMTSSAMASFMGSCVKNIKTAQELIPIIFVPQMLFSGFFVASTLIPMWLRWCQFICSLTYGTRLFMLAEFRSCINSLDEITSGNCNIILTDNLGGDYDSNWWYWLVLCSLFWFFRISAVMVLKMKATKFY